MSDQTATARTSPVASFIGRRWAPLFLALETVIFCIIANGFFRLHAFSLVFIAGIPLFLLGVAETYVIITGGIDLSVGFIFGFASVVSAELIVAFQGLRPSDTEAVHVGCLATLVIGVIPGYINGWLVARLWVPPFIATYSMLSVSFGVSEVLVNGSRAGYLPHLVTVVGTSFFAYFIPGRGLSFFSHERVARSSPSCRSWWWSCSW